MQISTRKYSEPKMQRKRKFTYEQFLELYNKQLSDQKIADKLNVSNSFIAHTRWKHGLPATKPKRNSNPTSSYKKLKETNKKAMKKQNQKPERKEAKRNHLKNYMWKPSQTEIDEDYINEYICGEDYYEIFDENNPEWVTLCGKCKHPCANKRTAKKLKTELANPQTIQ